ncbi:MAG TPA: glycosyltransferase family 4 protein [Vicinamibacterales bacterium]|jgi:glycosyltransferase involved in cell wall biosynthesis|nr:glycosyltransferase family 4 protein [Vicinamibacterales bacterium]
MTAPLRIAVLARAVMPLHGLGGLERSVHDLVRHLAARDVDVTLIVPPATVPSDASSASRSSLTSPRIAIRHVPYVTFPFAGRRGTTILDRSTAYPLYGWRAGRLAAAMAQRGDVDVIHGFGASLLGATASHVVPLVLNPQGLEEFGATAAAQPALKRAGYAPLRWAVRRCARAADCIIATDASLEPTIARHLSPKPGQVETIPNGIDLDAASSAAGPDEGASIRRRHGLAPEDIVLLSVGRLERNKGFDVLARALGHVSRTGALRAGRWRWVIVGGGPFRTDIERAIAGEGLASHVIFAGRVSESDLHAWYEAASLFVHPTRYEGSSLVTLEAMAHRRAIVATRAGGLPDKVRPGQNGWLVPPDDASALASAIEDALRDPARLTAMGLVSRTIVEREFAWPVIADRHIAMYERLRSGRPSYPSIALSH